ncbi:Ubiquitin conjugation factor E4 [Balamuthia mandrillaris]
MLLWKKNKEGQGNEHEQQQKAEQEGAAAAAMEEEEVKDSAASSLPTREENHSERQEGTAEQPVPSQDELRRRRLARFGAVPAAAEPSTTPATSSSSTSSSSSLSGMMDVMPTTIRTEEGGSSTLRPTPSQAMDIEQQRQTPSSAAAATEMPTSPLSISPINPSAKSSGQQAWENSFLKRVLAVTLSSAEAAEKEGAVVYLSNLAKELEQEQGEQMMEEQGALGEGTMLLSKDLTERIIVDCLSSPSDPCKGQNHLDFLIACYNRAHEEGEKATIKKNAARSQTVQHVKNILISYASLLLLWPETWPHSIDYREDMAKLFLSNMELDPENIHSVSPEFLEQFIAHLTEEELSELFVPLLDELSYKLKAFNLLSMFATLFRVAISLTQHKRIAALAVSLPLWVPSTNPTGREIETNSFLGPFFRLASSTPDMVVADHYFSAPSQLSQLNINTAHNSIRNALLTSQRMCCQVIKQLLKASPNCREKVLEWFAAVANFNIERTRIQVDRRKVSTDGFLLNTAAVLLELCVPFMDRSSPKLKMIDPGYLLVTDRLNVSEDTKLAATSEDVRQLKEAKRSSTQAPGFISECFFLTLRCMHIGFLKACARYGVLMRALYEQQSARDALIAQRSEWVTSVQIAANEALLEKIRNQIEEINRDRLCMEAQLFEPTFLGRTTDFYLLVCMWLVQLVDPEGKGLPLPESPPPEASALPEHCVEDVLEYFLFLARFSPRTLEETRVDDLLNLCVYLLASPSHAKNPYLRSKIVETLNALTPKQAQYKFPCFERNVLACKNLAPALMRFYVEIEFVERSSNFYDKFNVRYYIAALMKFLWKLPEHHAAIEVFSLDKDSFLRFVNMLINDSIYLLDESLAKLTEIRNYELEMANQAQWHAQDPVTRREREMHLNRLERQVRTYLLLGNETINMMHYLSKDIVAPFLVPELVDRLASMLNYFLEHLAGPKCTNLKVSQPEKYNFKPKQLLGKITDIYTHFAVHPTSEFPEAVARDGRSYSDEIFTRAAALLIRENIRQEVQFYI